MREQISTLRGELQSDKELSKRRQEVFLQFLSISEEALWHTAVLNNCHQCQPNRMRRDSRHCATCPSSIHFLMMLKIAVRSRREIFSTWGKPQKEWRISNSSVAAQMFVYLTYSDTQAYLFTVINRWKQPASNTQQMSI